MTPMPGVSQRRAGSRALQLAVEDRDRPEVLLAEPGRELLGEDDRAVVAARAAEGDRQAGLALADVGRHAQVEEVVEVVEELLGDGLAEDEVADRVVRPDSWRSSAT